MILRRERSLKNNVYFTKTFFVKYGTSDAIDGNSAAEEARIIDDFGAPKVSVGGSFSGIVKVTDDGKVEVVEKEEPTEADEVKIEFVLAMNEVNLDNTFSAALSINANSTKAIRDDKDNNKVLLTAEQVAEAKCKIFEKVIKDRAEKKILEYKKKSTDFENEFEEFEIPVR